MPLEFYILLSGIAGAVISYSITAIWLTRRHTRLYNRGWNAGREFALRNLHNTITR